MFVDGCFWHACPEHGSKPRANEWYWGPKLIKNVERDRVNDAALILAGWTVVRLWEHVPIDEAVGTVVTALTATEPPNRSRPPPTIRLASAPLAVADSGAPCACSCLRRSRRWPRPSGPTRRPAARLRGHARAARGIASGDEEELEYSALTEAARASLRMLAGDPTAPPCRVVLAADIPVDGVKLDARAREPGRVLVTAAIPIDKLASAHVDDAEAGTDVRAAAEALDAADAGDEDARFAVDGAEGHELAWYATQELSYLAE